MNELLKLLERFRDSLSSDVYLREVVSSAVHEVVGFDVRLADIFIKGDTLHILTSPVKKSEIKLNEERILALASARARIKFRKILYK